MIRNPIVSTQNEPTIQSLAEGQQRLSEGLQNLTDLVRDFIDEQHHFNEQVGQRLESMQDALDEQSRFIGEQRQFNEQVGQRLESMQDAIGEHSRFMGEQRQFNERVERRLETMHNDMAEIKGGHARTETVRRAEVIAGAMGLIFDRALSAGELEDMVRESSVEGLSRDELDSFTKADLVIKVRDGDRFTSYIAVEISYTADQRDIERAQRNAELLTRFTGRPSRAVVASVRNDPVVNSLVNSGYINWYQIPLRDLHVA